MAAEDCEEEIRSLQAGEERRGSCVSQSNGRCFDSIMEQFFTLGAAHARQQIQALQEEFIRRFEGPATPVHMTGREERGGEWEEEQAQRAASRQMGTKEPGGCNEGAPAGSAFDLARYQDANGESGGGGYFNTPGNGPYTREGSRTPRRQQQMHEDENLWKRKKREEFGNREKEETARRRTQEEGTMKPQIDTARRRTHEPSEQHSHPIIFEGRSHQVERW